MKELLRNSGSYSFDRSELKSTLEIFFKTQKGEDAKLILQKLDGKLNSFVRKPFKDRIKMLFKKQGIVCDRKLLGIFVNARNTVVHSLDMLSPGDVNTRRSTTYMLRQFEVLTLNLMGYKGDFLDRWKHIIDPQKSPHIRPFEQVLEELTAEKDTDGLG